MKILSFIAALISILVFTGCATPSDKANLLALADMQKQIAANNQKVSEQAAAFKQFSAQVEELNKQLKELIELGQAQAKSSRKIESQMDAIKKSQENKDAENAGAAKINVAPLVDAGMNMMSEMRNRQTEQMAETLKLTDEQKPKFKAAMDQSQEAIRKSMTELRETGKFDWEKMRKVMEESKTKTDDALKSVLTEDQMAEYKKLQNQWMDRGQNFRGGKHRSHDNNTDSSKEKPARPGDKPAAAEPANPNE